MNATSAMTNDTSKMLGPASLKQKISPVGTPQLKTSTMKIGMLSKYEGMKSSVVIKLNISN